MTERSRSDALAETILPAVQVVGDYVTVEAETLKDAGIGPDTVQYSDWLLRYGLRQYGKRKGIYRIGRQYQLAIAKTLASTNVPRETCKL